MRMDIDRPGVEMFGIKESRAMTIDNSAKVFYTIISGLYSRKIESICREIISNARDGHTKRGNLDRPFFVHAPTRWEPFFAVRDYGTSIPHDTVMEYCSRIGWSSKEESNTEVGTFGYGMKSPFAYTSQFTLTCWLDGEKRIYSYHIDENGTPQIVLRDQSESDEEQGVEIRFDVKAHDIDAFHRAIRWVALPYDPCFESNMSGVRSASITRDDGLFFYSPDAAGARVEIGPVWYDIDFSQLPDSDKYEAAFGGQDDFVLRSTIGELGIVPSRESLEYTPKTCQNLIKLLAAAYDKIEQQISATLSGVTTVWEAAEKWRSMHNSGAFYTVAKNTDTPWGKFGSLLDFKFPFLNAEYVSEVRRLPYSIVRKRSTHFNRFSYGAVYVIDEERVSVSAINRRIFRHMRENDINEAVFVILPSPKGRVADKSEAMKRTKHDRDERKNALDRLYKTLTDHRRELLAAIQEFGCPTVLYQDELPEPEKIVYTKENTTIATYVPRGSKWEIAVRSPVEDRLNIVFELENREFFPQVSKATLTELVEETIGLKVGEVIGVSKTNYAKFLKVNPEWTGYKDIFNSYFYNVDELTARRDELVSLRNLNFRDSQGHARVISRALRVMPKLPASVQNYLNIVSKMEAENARRKERLDELLKTGPDANSCAWLIHAVTGKHAPAREVDDESDEALLDAAHRRMCEEYPLLRSTYMRDSDELLSHVLGLDALRALKIAAFYDTAEAA